MNKNDEMLDGRTVDTDDIIDETPVSNFEVLDEQPQHSGMALDGSTSTTNRALLEDHQYAPNHSKVLKKVLKVRELLLKNKSVNFVESVTGVPRELIIQYYRELKKENQ